jgi:hypothetical protein
VPPTAAVRTEASAGLSRKEFALEIFASGFRVGFDDEGMAFLASLQDNVMPRVE